jgi:hypothetical protein
MILSILVLQENNFSNAQTIFLPIKYSKKLILPRPSDSTSDCVFCDDEDDDVDDGQTEDDDVGDVLRVPPEDCFVGKETFVNQPE